MTNSVKSNARGRRISEIFKAASQEAGCAYAAAQFADLEAHGVDGLHLYTMNRPAVASSVMQRLNVLRAARG